MELEKTYKSILVIYTIGLWTFTYFLWDLSVPVFLYGEIFRDNYMQIVNAFPESTEYTSNGIGALAALSVMILIIISAYRLYKYKSYARELFIFYLIWAYFTSFVIMENSLHISLLTSPQNWGFTLLTLIEGAILVFIYFTSLKDKFSNSK